MVNEIQYACTNIESKPMVERVRSMGEFYGTNAFVNPFGHSIEACYLLENSVLVKECQYGSQEGPFGGTKPIKMFILGPKNNVAEIERIIYEEFSIKPDSRRTKKQINKEVNELS